MPHLRAAMPLHHRPDFDDIRFAYDSDRSSHLHAPRSYFESQSSNSDRSCCTQSTDYCSGSPPRQPARLGYPIPGLAATPEFHSLSHHDLEESPRSSVDTYASTVPSEEELPDDLADYVVPQYQLRPYEQAAVPSTPSAFAELFPSHRRLAIRHDNSTPDGNMNLRIDTEVIMQNGRRCDMTLFHLRMHDLRNREFSLRRYCRDSGREVCHTARKLSKPIPEKRPSFQRSLSNAIHNMRSRADSRSNAKPHKPIKLQRNDSGYGSVLSPHETELQDRSRPDTNAPEDTIKLEFSNYAQLHVKRAGSEGSQRWDFEYWGVHYSWRKVTRKDPAARTVSYHLSRAGADHVLAYILPASTTPSQMDEDRRRGGWINPCAMWIADENIVHAQKDVSDVVIASGLIALVDDSVRTSFCSSTRRRLSIGKLPVGKLQIGVDYVGPKRFIHEVFKRDTSTHPLP